jgi:hypothetical protein
MSKVFESLVNGSLLDPIGGNNGTLTAGVSRGFVQTDKGLALECDGANTKVVYGDIENIKSIGLWINLDTTTEQILEGSANAKLIHANSGTLTYADFDNAYIDNVDTNTITIGWHCIVITSTTNVDMSAVTLALNNASYGKFQCARIQFWDDDISVKTRNDFYRDFLNAGQTSPQKRGFTVQKPTDLSRHTDDGLVAAYNMTLVNGQVIDLTGNGNDGTNVGCLPSEDGLVFNGVDSGLTGSLVIATATNATILCRYQRNNTSNNMPILGLSSTNSFSYLRLTNDGRITLETDTNTNTHSETLPSDDLIDHTFAIVVTNGSSQMYFDGIAFGSAGTLTDNLTINRIGRSNSNFWNGTIYNTLKIYNRAVSATEVKDYHNSFILPTLVETFDEGADGIAKLPTDWHKGTGTYKIDQWNVAQGETVTNGGFDTDSDWTKGTGWTISSGKAHANISSGTPILRQNDIGYRVGHRYRVKFTISNLTSGAIKVDLGAGVSSFTASANGSYSEVLMGAVEADLRFYPPASDFVGSIDNVSVVEIDYANDGSGIYYEPIKSGDKYLECTVAGTIATLSGQAFGTWEWDMLKGADGNTASIHFMNNAFPIDDGYRLVFANNENMRLQSFTNGAFDTDLLITSTIFNINQWYHVKMTATKAGIRTVWIDGVLEAAASGSNPVTDTTYSTSVFTVLDNDAGDRVANFNYKDEIEQ